MNRALVLLLVCLTSVPVIAELSPQLKEWGAGPAQWIMTPEEQRAWRKVATDSDAVHFIDLFWARRDPSPGTGRNELRNEFESRVAYADTTFGEKRKRGAMTDRGRVYVTMGDPTTMDGVVNQMGTSAASDDMSGARQTSIRHIWVWEKADAQKFDMGRIVVVFVEDPITHRVQRDPTRADFGRAGPAAIRKAIVSADLTAVPTWAATGGLKPVAPVIFTEAAETTAPVAEPAPAYPAPEKTPAVASNTPGVSRLTLGSSFKGGSDVPWTVQYCSAKAESPRLKHMLLIAGPLDGKATEQRTREKEAKPEQLAAQPGCYAIRGTVPVSKLTPGRYRVTVMIDNVTTGDAYTLKQEFRVE
jgi:GWxTD domain-containing protein